MTLSLVKWDFEIYEHMYKFGFKIINNGILVGNDLILYVG